MGEVFAGRYELLEPIGSGGMGTVWLVHDRRDDAVRAAKLVRQVDAALLLRFVRELSTRIDHAHTVMPRGWAGEDDTVLFTMDVVRGGSVHDLLEDFGTLPPAWAACLTDQLLDALSAVHRAGIVHRDIKPANLLLEPTGRDRPYLRLTDFGIAVPLHEPRMTAPAVVLGTRGYRPPESMVGADPEPTQDLYGVGVVLAQMLTGDRPGDGETVPEDAPAGIDPGLWWVVRGLTERDPQRRVQSADQARRMLQQSGWLPPPGVVPDDGGADIEVFEHVSVPDVEGLDGSAGQPSRGEDAGEKASTVRRVGAAPSASDTGSDRRPDSERDTGGDPASDSPSPPATPQLPRDRGAADTPRTPQGGDPLGVVSGHGPAGGRRNGLAAVGLISAGLGVIVIAVAIVLLLT